MQSYCHDLRDRVLWALQRGEKPAHIARRLEISRAWVYQVRDRVQKTGMRSSFPIGGHRRSGIAGREAEVRSGIEAQPGLALAEICNRLAEHGVAVKVGALWHQLNQWNLTFKKTPARQRARSGGRATGTPGVAGSAAHDERRKARMHR